MWEIRNMKKMWKNNKLNINKIYIYNILKDHIGHAIYQKDWQINKYIKNIINYNINYNCQLYGFHIYFLFILF